MSAVLKDILATVVPTFRAKGYTGSGQNYRRITETAVSVINFQKSSGGERFYVNVGVQPLFVWTEGESMPVAKEIKEPECIFRERLEPPDGESLGWRYSLELSAALVQRFDMLYASFVVPLMTIPGPITDACIGDFPLDSVHPLLGARNARNFLHFARIALATGNRERAEEFAIAAIEICPPRASTLRFHLDKTLADAKT